MTDIVGVIFDLDGVLIDTESASLETLDGYLRELGSEISPVALRAVCGRPAGDLPLFFREWLPGLKNAELYAVVGEYRSRLEALYKGGRVRMFDGAESVLDELKAFDLRLGLATSSSRKWVEYKVGREGILERFEIVVSADDIVHGKPHPEIYATAAWRLGVAPTACLAIEDSLAGVTSARSAGLGVIAVASTHKREELSSADTVVDNLRDVPSAVGTLLKARRERPRFP